MKKMFTVTLIVAGLAVVFGIAVIAVFIDLIEEEARIAEDAAQKTYEVSLNADYDFLDEADADDTNAIDIDSGLVNASGEEWVSGKAEYDSYRAFTFRANGRYRYRFFVAGEDNDRFTGGGIWFTNSGTITLISGRDAKRTDGDGDGGENSQPYRVSGDTVEIGGDMFIRQRR